MKKIIIVIIISFFCGLSVYGQKNKSADSLKTNNILIQAELFVPFQGGYDIQGGYKFGSNLVLLKYRYVPVSDLLDAQRNEFNVKFSTIQVSYSRFILGSKKHL
ncbi:MAG: hypothetical protein NTW54_10005, partial [Bacteroidetes bacterium]|nr:hypothetical protein [Bacteroidota bacterium]